MNNKVYIRETLNSPPKYWVKYGDPRGLNQLYPLYAELADTLKAARKRQRELKDYFIIQGFEL